MAGISDSRTCSGLARDTPQTRCNLRLPGFQYLDHAKSQTACIFSPEVQLRALWPSGSISSRSTSIHWRPGASSRPQRNRPCGVTTMY